MKYKCNILRGMTVNTMCRSVISQFINIWIRFGRTRCAFRFRGFKKEFLAVATMQ